MMIEQDAFSKYSRFSRASRRFGPCDLHALRRDASDELTGLETQVVDNPPSVAQGGRGVVVSGCPACKKRINTTAQFLDHLANDAMPLLINQLADKMP